MVDHSNARRVSCGQRTPLLLQRLQASPHHRHSGRSNARRVLALSSPFPPSSIQFANDLQQKGIRTTLIPDSGVGYLMHTVQLVLMGAEVVVETGGVINKLGSLQVGVLAKTFNVPVYIAVESYKFARIYPLNQKSVPVTEADRQISEKARPKELDEGVEFGAARCDYLPPEYITFLMTDLGVLAPPSVSDELIKLYWWIVCWKCEETNKQMNY